MKITQQLKIIHKVLIWIHLIKKLSSDIVSIKEKENYQKGDGSSYKEVNYADGNFRQYDNNGNLIGSSYESDPKQAS